ncbi:stage II sporulation protein R [Anaerobacterium chartisolvens]|uniref:Stage II sporulation protein R n=1 Tax=Anaerobacterium chartisolvens TaxID=1297424 RepID=A0A369BBJ2_9FIRM|nr:stage II sporulation protein R [Anaerobacterium chartisolvens]RCX17857.1 stage II sporulation protein R [Anaerobacterium chartisolvens]
MNRIVKSVKGFGSGVKNNIPLKAVILLFLIAILWLGVYLTTYSEDVNKGLSENLIRLHVVANSDGDVDQALKRDVRDVIINYMQQQLKDSKDIENTKNVISRDMEKIEELAKEEIFRQGKAYEVKADMGIHPFPTKMYGDITLPAGNYQALRVVIGKGEGANWWCVLFPPLCFVDATHGTISDSVKADLKNILTAEEYDIVTSADSEDDIPIKVRFKIVEFFQDSRIKISNLLGRIF